MSKAPIRTGTGWHHSRGGCRSALADQPAGSLRKPLSLPAGGVYVVGHQPMDRDGAGAFGGRAAVGIHGGGDRPVEVDLSAVGNPAAEVTVGEHALEDAAFGDDEDQA